jgi:hypothetical protein
VGRGGASCETCCLSSTLERSHVKGCVTRLGGRVDTRAGCCQELDRSHLLEVRGWVVAGRG